MTVAAECANTRENDKKEAAEAASRLLAWYDLFARPLPWRVGPAERRNGVRPDPYRVWLSEIMLQQTTVATVSSRFQQFLARWPRLADLAAAPIADVLGEWAGLGYYARARNLHACAQAVVRDHQGEFPQTEAALRALPGVGPYTSAAIAAIAFDAHAIVIDGNVERVAARFFAIDAPKRLAHALTRELLAGIWPQDRSGDFAQALMDLGAGVCTPRNPRCQDCPLSKDCEALRLGFVAELPRRAPKPEKPHRTGNAFAIFDEEGRILVERRPEKGLLGGMLGLPGTVWTEQPALPPGGAWRHAGEVRHVFTHFRLTLNVWISTASEIDPQPEGMFLPPAEIEAPTVMRKAIDVACAALPPQSQPRDLKKT